MGAGTSTEQVAEKPGEEQAEQSNDLGQQEQAAEVVAESGDAKLLHKNGKIAIINGTAEEEEAAEASVQTEDANGVQEELVDKNFEQPEPAKVTLNSDQEDKMEVVPSSTTTKENGKEDGQVEALETIEAAPVSEEKAESPEQASEVGFKKVFKFVGFKFTVKKEKVEKTEPVQLLTVKKDEVEVNGTSSHEEHVDVSDEGKTETKQEAKDIVQQTESPADAPQAVESPGEGPTEAQNKEASSKETQKKEEEAELEKDKKSPESPTNAVVTETSSPFRRFFTQGWAGLRKKTSFKKSKEEDPQEVEKHINIEEKEKPEISEVVKEETTKEITEDQSVPEDLSLAASEEPTENNTQISLEELKAEKASPDKAEEQKTEETVKVDEVLVSEELQIETIAEEVSSAPCDSAEEKADTETLEVNLESQGTNPIAPSVDVTNESQPEVAQKSEAPANDQLISSTESTEQEKSQEVITTEAELLSSQEKVKVQGSPLKKLFSSSGLRKLSGKKSKSKKEDDTKIDTTAEPATASAESPEAAEVDGGDSSPSSPDESGETSPTEKLAEEVPQTTETEGEGATSDGERKKDGITPWASFKKLVTPKRRPKQPSESDKEDEPEKAKTSTMSSTDSAGSVENQEETRETVEEQKLEKSTEENKKKADSSVSWDTLICVGSSKKRARKTSDSDEEEVQKSQEESKKAEGEVVQTKEDESESPITSSQEQQVQDCPSPDQASSPTEGDGVSTWQSFKRLVTPRRKSRTKVEEKTDETTAGSNAEQSTSEGEAGKEESWVSFKKLIPGRKKKKSDAKQEQVLSSADQPVNENTEDDSDEPAVVPLAEFDAAELEKLDAQKSLVESVPTHISEEPKESLEKPNDELIHAVTVTLIEGERAVTSLEERSPSWISAKVAETIEHAKEVEEAMEKIKTEITVEETVVFSTVSQVVSETQSALINEVELTSEALTALEEAIETSCAEETTEMLTAASQLGESVDSTEQATPVPEEEDVSVENLQEKKQHVDDVLYAVAESAKLASDFIHQGTVNINVVSTRLPNLEEDFQEINKGECTAILTKDISLEFIEEQIKTNISLPAEEQDVEAVIIAVTEKVPECVPTDLNETVQDTCEEKVEKIVEESSIVFEQNQAVPHIDEDKSVSVIEKASESTIITAIDQDTEFLSVSAEKQSEKSVGYASTEKSAEDTNICDVVSKETLASSNAEAVLVEELTSNLESLSTESSEGKAEELFSIYVHSEKESKVEIPFAVESCEKFANSLEDQLHTDECSFLSPNVQVEEIVCAKVQTELSEPLSSEVNAEENSLLPNEVQSEKAFAVSDTEQIEKAITRSSEEVVAEVLPISFEVPAKEVSVVSLEDQINEGVTMKGVVDAVESATAETEVQIEEMSPLATEVQVDKGVFTVEESSSLEGKLESEEGTVEEQSTEGVTLTKYVHSKEYVISNVQDEKDSSLSAEVQAEEASSVTAEGLVEESVSETEVQAEDGALVTVEVKVEESAPKTAELQTEDYVSATDEIQGQESFVLEADTQEKNIVVSSEVLAENGTPMPCEMQVSEDVTVDTELQGDEDVRVLTNVQSEEGSSLTDFKVQESAPFSNKVQEEFISTPNKVEITAVSILSEERFADALPVSSESRAEESTTVLAVSEAEDTFVPAKVEDEGITDELVKGLVENGAIEGKAKEDVVNSDETQAVEDISIPAEVQSENDMPSKEQAEDVVILPAEEPTAGYKEQAEDDIVFPAEEPTAGNKEQTDDVVILPAEESTAGNKEQAEDDVILPAEELTTGIIEQTDDVVILSAEEPTAATKEQTDDVVILPAEEPTAGTKEQAEDVVNFPAEKPTVGTKEQTDNIAILPTEEPTAGTKEQAEDVVILPAEKPTAGTKEQTDDIAILPAEEPTAGTKEQAEDIVILSAEEGSTGSTESTEKEVLVSDELQAVEHAPEAHIEEVADAVEEGNKEHFSNGMQKECFLNKEESEENVLSVNDEGEKESGSSQDKEQPKECIQIQVIENVITVPDIDTSGTCTASGPFDIKDMSSLSPPEDAGEPGDHTGESEEAKIDFVTLKTEGNLDQLSLVQEEIAEVKEEVITFNIPEIESIEASKASEPVTAASVEERVLGETVKLIESSEVNVQLLEETDDNIPSEDPNVTSEDLNTVVEIVSQKAAAIVDAAIEAATSCFVVDTSNQDETLIETTMCTEELKEEKTVETVVVESHNTTIEEHITETTEKRVVQIILDVDYVSVEGQNEGGEHISQVQEPEPSCKPVNVDNSTAPEEQQDVSGLDDSQKDLFVVGAEVQNKKDESDANNLNQPLAPESSVTQATDLVYHESAGSPLTIENEIKPSLPTDIKEEDIHKTTTQTESSDTSTPENTQTVES